MVVVTGFCVFVRLQAATSDARRSLPLDVACELVGGVEIG